MLQIYANMFCIYVSGKQIIKQIFKLRPEGYTAGGFQMGTADLSLEAGDAGGIDLWFPVACDDGHCRNRNQGQINNGFYDKQDF